MKYCILFILLGCFFTPPSYATCFQGDCVNGQGAYRSADGVIYIGQWQDGKYHGQGKIFYPDGSRYEGSWQAGKFHGHGTETMQDGRKRTGLFAHGELIEEEIAPPAARPNDSRTLKQQESQVLAGKAKKAVQVPATGKRLPGEYPESSAGFLTAADLQDRTQVELRMMVNEIYARHSHIFVNADMQRHFSRQH